MNPWWTVDPLRYPYILQGSTHEQLMFFAKKESTNIYFCEDIQGSTKRVEMNILKFLRKEKLLACASLYKL